jgi:putative DNA-invertase from lambdoid prophage Rac
VSGNGISRLVLTILAAVAEAERDRIRERVTTVKRDQHARGRYLGGKVPFGYRATAEGALEPIPEQQAAIARALALRQAGTSIRAIRATLADEGHRLGLDTLHRIVGHSGPTQ